TTMAEHMRRGGYQTASFTANPNAGRVIGLERGLDVLRDAETEHHSTSSVDLHEWFWRWREDYPGRPYWVHFQSTDVHEPNEPVAPFAHLYVAPQERDELVEWDERLFRANFAEFGQTGINDWYEHALAKAGVDRLAYYDRRRGLYDETMAHQDQQLRRLVEDLKAAGEWENTVLVIGADHGHPAGTFARFGRGLIAPQPEPWQGALFDAYSTRVPLVVVWPEHIPGGRRYPQPVSMIDVLPTLLDLLDLPRPEVLQGQSLAPLLTGGTQEVRPVILDEFRVDQTSGEMIGNLEVIDGRWGASLEIGAPVAGGDAEHGRRAVPAGGRWGSVHPSYQEVPRLLLYDLERDPFALEAVNDQYPDLVEKYRTILLDHWRANQALATRFTEASETPLSPEQLEQLEALGYIQ
ncbi:MAG: sulfatase-like hydrolase/transferase, partial [Thermoanaerobaculia bacterium]